LSLDVNASDTGGTSALLTPPTRTQATSSNASFHFSQPVTIPFNGFIPVPGGVEFTNNLLLSGGAADFPNVAGTYAFTVTNSSGQSTSDTSHTLDKLEVIPNPANLHTSDLSTTPVFMFTDPNPTPGVAGLQRFYQAWIYDGPTKVVIDMLPVSSTPSFAIPPGILQPGHPYFLRALSLDVDITETATVLHSRLEDRASEFLSFTPVPEPSTLLLLSSGLLGLAVVAWRRRNP